MPHTEVYQPTNNCTISCRSNCSKYIIEPYKIAEVTINEANECCSDGRKVNGDYAFEDSCRR